MHAGPIDQVAAEFGITRRTLYRLIQRHNIPTYQQTGDRRTYVNRDEVRPFLGLQPKQGPTELVALYAHRADIPSGVWADLLTDAKDQIGILVYAAPFLYEEHPDLNGLLAAKCARGCTVRVTLGDPESEAVRQRGAEERYGSGIQERCRMAIRAYSPLIGIAGFELRLHDTTLYNSIYRFDDQMLVNMHIWGANAYAAPVLHLKETRGGPLFESYLASFDEVWQSAKALTTGKIDP